MSALVYILFLLFALVGVTRTQDDRWQAIPGSVSVTLSWPQDESRVNFTAHLTPVDAGSLSDAGSRVFSWQGELAGSHTFNSLVSGARYRLEVTGVTDNHTTTVSLYNAQLITFPVVSQFNAIKIQNVSENSLVIAWNVPESNAINTNYSINITDLDVSTNIHDTIYTTNSSVTISDLNSGHNYSFEITASSYEVRSLNSTIVFDNTVPGEVEFVRLSLLRSDQIEVIWKASNNNIQDFFRLNVKDAQNRDVGFSGCAEPVVTPPCTITLPPEVAAGSIYTVSVVAVRGMRESIPTTNRLQTKPASVLRVYLVNRQVNQLSIQWDDPSNFTNFNFFRVSYKNAMSEIITINVSEIENDKFTAILQPLLPASLYFINITTVAGGIESEPVINSFFTEPSSPINLRLSQSSISATDSLTLLWDPPNTNEMSEFIISINDSNNQSVYTNSTTGHFTGLTPGTNYTLKLRAAVNNSVFSRPIYRNFFTAPEIPSDFSVFETDETSVSLTWKAPSVGKFSGYFIQVNDSLMQNKRFDQGTTQTEFSGLNPGTLYQFSLYSVVADKRSQPFIVYSTTKLRGVTLIELAEVSTNFSVITWDAIDQNTSNTIIGYRVSIYPSALFITVNSTGSALRHRFDDLFPGREYNVTIQTISTSRVLSAPFGILFNTKPIISSVLTEKSALTTGDNITISYTPTLANVSIYQRYLFSLHCLSCPDSSSSSVRTVERPFSEQSGSFGFDHLIPGTTYRIDAATISGQQKSQPISITVHTVPDPPRLTYTTKEDRINLTITAPTNGDVQYYQVNCSSLRGCSPATSRVNHTFTVIVLSYTGLLPNGNYNFRVVAIWMDKTSIPVSLQTITEDGAPGPVEDFRVERLQGMRAGQRQLRWSKPQITNGIIKSYTIRCIGHRKSLLQIIEVDEKEEITVRPTPQNEEMFMLDISDLKAGFNYTITIRANTIKEGQPTTLFALIEVSDPGFREGERDTRPSFNTSLSTSSTLSFTFTDPFSQDNGLIINYTVVITTDPQTAQLNHAALPTWQQAMSAQQSMSAQQAMSAQSMSAQRTSITYAAIAGCSGERFFSLGDRCTSNGATSRSRRQATTQRSRSRRQAMRPRSVMFVVGAETCVMNERAAAGDQHYCNGPLRPGVRYYAALRAYTSSDRFTDSLFSHGVTTASIAEPGPGGVSQVVVIVVTVLSVLLLSTVIFVTLLVFVLYKRGSLSHWKRSGTKRGAGRGSQRPISQQPLRLSSISAAPPEVTSHPVLLSEFSKHVNYMSADSDYKFALEYEELKSVGRNQAIISAELPCNRAKNRFTNVLPYDHSRVKLLPTDDEDGSDYINANYMPGHYSKREYIVTQGPLPSTRDDFWRMIWEQNVHVIVMLTKCVEKGREKCDHYWPVDSEPMFYGDLQIIALNEVKNSEWIVTDFQISKGEQSHKISHFHFIGWPDFAVPERPQSLVKFVRMVRAKYPKPLGPIVVHCSAGVGRSGAYISVDRLLLELVEEPTHVDIFNMVHEMRLLRPHMVQTEQQYICIHHCLQCVLEKNEDVEFECPGEVNNGFVPNLTDDEGIQINDES